MSHRKIAIVGTAPSWQMTPWSDVDLSIWSLNDAYNLSGFQRADRWYDLHPLNKFFYAPDPVEGQRAVVYAHQIPPGQYVRPARHLDWLATQAIPVYLHPDFANQHPTAGTWPHAKAFPKGEIEAAYGTYCTSSPQWMLAHAMLEGAREVHIYGIHLATESEYIEQRPGFEFLIGSLLGPGKRRMTTAKGLRRYESEDGIVILPEASPVLSAKFQYAFEPSPRRALEPLRWELHKAEVKLARTIDALKKATWPITWFQEPIPGAPDGAMKTRVTTVSTLQQELWQYEALVADCQEQMARVAAGV